jgi:DNA-binding Lrp family transcriptional regulator
MNSADLRALERAIVRELYPTRGQAPLSTSKLAEKIGGRASALAVLHLLGELHRAGVVEMAGEYVQLSTAVRRLAIMGMLGRSRARR